jgi:hypothetical protein
VCGSVLSSENVVIVFNPATYTMDTRALSLGIKRSGREADHSPPSSAEVKNS